MPQSIQRHANVSIEEITREDFCDRGCGGIYTVGKTKACPPRLINLTYEPENDVDTTTTSDSITLVGKGIFYDTGRLAIKSKTSMCRIRVAWVELLVFVSSYFHPAILILSIKKNGSTLTWQGPAVKLTKYRIWRGVSDGITWLSWIIERRR